jgi:hypothetical protein
MNYCPKCGEHLFKGTSYCLACHHPVKPPQPVKPLQPEDEDETTRVTAEDYTTHVSPEPPRRPTRHSTGPIPPRESAPLPQYASAPLQPPRRRWPLYTLAALCVAFAFVALLAILALVGERTGFITFYNPLQPGDEKQQSPTPAQQETPQPTPTRATPTPPPPPARVSNTNVYAPGSNANVYYPPGGNANYYPPPARTPQNQVVFSGTIRVPNLQAMYYQFTVPQGHPATLSGGFTAWGGNNDIDTLVLPASQFAGWQSLGRYYALYNSGYIHAGKINLRLEPGDYVLVFTNRQAILTSKNVQGFVQLFFD